MQKRALVVAAVVLVALGAWVWHTEGDPPKPTEEDVFGGALLGELTAADIAGVDIGPIGKAVQLRRSGATWALEPGARPAELAVAQLTARALSSTESLRRLELPPSPDYGLGPGALSVVVLRADGSRNELQLGDAVPVGNGRYVSVDGVVHVADAAALTVFERDPLDFRDRRVLPLDRDTIDAIDIEPAGGPTVAITRTDGVWRLRQDPGWRADPDVVDDLLRALVGLTANGYRDAPSGPASVRVRVSAGGTAATLSAGPMDSAGQRDLWAEGALLPPGVGGDVARADAVFLDVLPDAAEWRSSRFTPLRPRDVTGFTWSAGGEDWTLLRDAEGWSHQDHPDAALDADAVNAFVTDVLALEAAEFVGEAAAEGAVEVARLDLHAGEDAVWRVELLRGPNVDLVRVVDEPGLLEVSADAHDLLGRLHPFTAASTE